MVNPYRRPIRHLEYTIAAGYNLLQLTKKGEDITAKDVAKAGLLTSLQIAAIYYTDKLVASFITRGYVATATKTLAGVQLAYVAGAVASVTIDGKEGLENYNEFIDDVITGDVNEVSRKFNFSINMLMIEIATSQPVKDTETAISVLIDYINPF